MSAGDSTLKKKNVLQLRRELKKLENQRATALRRFNRFMDGAWGDDPASPLPMKQEARRWYLRWKQLKQQVDETEEELISRYRPN